MCNQTEICAQTAEAYKEISLQHIKVKTKKQEKISCTDTPAPDDTTQIRAGAQISCPHNVQRYNYIVLQHCGMQRKNNTVPYSRNYFVFKYIIIQYLWRRKNKSGIKNITICRYIVILCENIQQIKYAAVLYCTDLAHELDIMCKNIVFTYYADRIFRDAVFR